MNYNPSMGRFILQMPRLEGPILPGAASPPVSLFWSRLQPTHCSALLTLPGALCLSLSMSLSMSLSISLSMSLSRVFKSAGLNLFRMEPSAV